MRPLRAAILLSGLIVAAAAEPARAVPAKALAPVPPATVSLIAAKGAELSAPILMRIFKKESELELWKRARSGRYVLLKTYPICRWSGQLGPKTTQGDRQAPEGFYAVPPHKMNPNSAFHLSFDLGYPNAFDQAHGRTGAFLMVHGTCSSAGCFAMTDEQITEIYALAREAFAGGQRAFQVQSYPFRMTAQNMARARSERHIAFWRQLKEGYDRFEATGEELKAGVSDGRYTFAPSRDPAKEAAVQARRAEEERKIAALVENGIAAVRITYQDGGMHARFASLSRRGAAVGPISRPETLAEAGRELVIVPARKKPPVVVAAKAAPSYDPSDPIGALFAPAPIGGPRLGRDMPALTGSAPIVSAAWTPAPRKVLALRSQ